MSNRKMILYIAQSLDGYIARENGAIDWLVGDGSNPEGDFGYDAFYAGIDTVIMGRATYQQIKEELSVDVWPYEGKKCYVFTSRDLPEDDKVEFVSMNPVELVRKLRKEEGTGVWILGGAKVVRDLVNENEIDDYIIATAPILIGEGIKLFSEGLYEIQLKLIDTQVWNGMIMTHYIKR